MSRSTFESANPILDEIADKLDEMLVFPPPRLKHRTRPTETPLPRNTWVDGEIQLVPHDRCPKCYGVWDFKLKHTSCSECGAALGREVKQRPSQRRRWPPRWHAHLDVSLRRLHARKFVFLRVGRGRTPREFQPALPLRSPLTRLRWERCPEQSACRIEELPNRFPKEDGRTNPAVIS